MPVRLGHVGSLLSVWCLALVGCYPSNAFVNPSEEVGAAFVPAAPCLQSPLQPGASGQGIESEAGLPREANKVILAEYIIEPPDVLRIEATRVLPSRGPISGDRTVRPDGTIGLGLYGTVRVAGLTLPQAKAAVEAHLAKEIIDPEVSIDILTCGSKCYYVIENRAGQGERFIRLCFTGNETVLDAVSQLGCLPATAGPRQIWIARPDPGAHDHATMLAVDWEAITRRGQMATNYQILPGDRIFVEEPVCAASPRSGSCLASPLRSLQNCCRFPCAR